MYGPQHNCCPIKHLYVKLFLKTKNRFRIAYNLLRFQFLYKLWTWIFPRFVRCSQKNLHLCIKTKAVTIGAEAMVHVHIVYTQEIYDEKSL